MDKTLIDIFSTIIAFVGLVGAITKFKYSQSRKTFYGENLFGVKGDIIDGYIVWTFTLLAAFGYIPHLLDLVFDFNIPERLYTSWVYIVATAIGLFVAIILVILIKKLAQRLSKISLVSESCRKIL